MRRAAAGLFVGFLALLGAAGAAVAQSSDVLIGAELRETQRLRLDVHEIDPSREATQAGGVPPCGSDHFTVAPEDGWLKFAEADTEFGCGEIRFGISVPPGVTRFTVSFDADREIAPEGATQLEVRQEFVIRDYLGNVHQRLPVFDPEDSTRPISGREVDVDLPLQGVNAKLAWYFDDRGALVQQGAVPQRVAFTGSVSNILVEFAGIPIEPVATASERQGIDGNVVLYSDRLRFDLPETSVVSGSVALVVRVPARLDLAAVIGPGGESIPLTAVQETQFEGVREIMVPPEVTGALGTGAYELQFQSTIPVTPTTAMAPLLLTFLAVPIVAGTFAFRSQYTFRRQATGEFSEASRLIVIALIFISFFYLGLILSIVTGGRLGIMASWPLQTEAGLFYGLLVVVAVAYLGVGIFTRRRLTQGMHHELMERQRINEELSRSNKELEQFAYVASHDLQEPLRMIASYVQLLERRYGEKLDADAHEFIGYAVGGANRLQRLINDLLEFSRVGTRAKPFQTIDMSAVMAQAITNLASHIQEQGAVVTHDELPVLVADASQVSQLLQNLVSNGIKFHRPGVKPRIHVGVQREETGWTFSVQDNGIGIDPKYYDRMFVIFQRLHSKEEYPGSGIGLAIAKKIVERHGGRIWIESRPGHGATFVFTIPRMTPASEVGVSNTPASP